MISALEISGIVTFPTTQDTWHFDDKIAQKYLFDALAFPAPKTDVFFDAHAALGALSRLDGQIVMKLRSGASSANVRLISNNWRGRSLVRKAFRTGFRQFDRVGMARDAWKSARFLQLNTIIHACKETAKIFFRSQYERVRGVERQYVLMQEFLPANDFDVRLVLMDGKAFGMRRFNREGDFRASGSGVFDFSPDNIPNSCVQLALVTAKRLGSTAIAFDFLFDGSNRPRKNEPMTPEEKRRAVDSFSNWRIAQFRMQQGRALLAACGAGDPVKVERLLTAFPDLIELRSPEGWTPLIIAAYGQKKDVVAVLLARGADANACGKKGTTVLMYAKTALVGQDAADLSILRALLDAGADPARHDALGKDTDAKPCPGLAPQPALPDLLDTRGAVQYRGRASACDNHRGNCRGRGRIPVPCDAGDDRADDAAGQFHLSGHLSCLASIGGSCRIPHTASTRFASRSFSVHDPSRFSVCHR